MKYKKINGEVSETNFYVFKKMNGEKISLIPYIKNYLKEHSDNEILLGCDSQNRGGITTYAVVIGFYTPGHGAHIIFNKWKSLRERISSVRLLNEVWASVELAEILKKEGLPKPKYIDIDINPDPKFKSNEVFRQAIGLCEGMGYHVRYKHTAPLIVTMADYIVKGAGA